MGLNYNVQFRVAGKTVDTNNSSIIISETNPLFVSSIGVGYNASILIKRRLSDASSLVIKPTIGGYFNPITTANNPAETRLRLWHLNLGYQYGF